MPNKLGDLMCRVEPGRQFLVHRCKVYLWSLQKLIKGDPAPGSKYYLYTWIYGVLWPPLTG